MGKGTTKVQSGYQPTGQPFMDTNFQDLQKEMTNNSQLLASTAQNGYSNIYGAVSNNPYAAQAQSGANNASQYGTNFVAPNQLYSSQNLMDGGNVSGAQANQVYGAGMGNYQLTANQLGNAAAYMNNVTSPQYMGRAQTDASSLYGAVPAATAGYGLAMPNYQQGMDAANQTYGANMSMLGMIPGMENAAQTVLNTGMDPQQALYDRNYQQTMQQQNAINAQQGVSGSPFGAGVAGQTASNFNIDWNTQQLQNQINALNAYTGTMGTAGGLASNFINGAAQDYGSLSGQATNNFNNLTNSATSNLNNLTTSADTMLQSAKAQQFSDYQSALNNATSRYGSLAGLANTQLGGATSDYSSMLNNQMNAYANASDLGTAGLTTMYGSANMPNQAYMQNQNQIMQALNGLVSGTNQSLQPMQQVQQNDLNYMGVGQNATQLQQQAQQYNNQNASSSLGGLANLFGLAGSSGLFGGSGGSGLSSSLMQMLSGGQMLGGAGNSLGGLAGLGAGSGLSDMSMLTADTGPSISAMLPFVM